MDLDVEWQRLSASLQSELALLSELVRVLTQERIDLGINDLGRLREAANQKEMLVPQLSKAQSKRKALMAGRPGLYSLQRQAPEPWAGEIKALNRRCADLAEQVFLLNRENGQLLEQGRQVMTGRFEALRFRSGRLDIYERGAGSLSIGGVSVIERSF